MGRSPTSMAGLAAVALLVAACSSGGSSPAPVASVVTPSGAVVSSVVAGPPAAPTNFTATRKSGSVPCPSADDTCSQVDFAWQAGADPEAGFRIYVAGTGEGPDATCQTAQTGATVRIGVKAAARTAQAFDPMATGGGQICYWITAVSSVGESAKVPAASNQASAPSGAPAVPAAPTGFTATRKTGVICPSADPNGDHCFQADFAWKASADPETGFRIYVAGTGEGPDASCSTEQPNATIRLEPGPTERTAQVFDPIAVGGGQICYWITAVGSAGESAQVAAAGN